MKAKLSYVTLGVADLARSLRFYREGLGFQPHNHHPEDEFVFLRLEGAWMALATLEAFGNDVGRPGGVAIAAGSQCFALAHNVASPSEVERVFATAVACGAQAVRAPWETSWGGVSSFFADPDGHLWEVGYNPFTDLT